jgi:hypothetical protein
LQPTQIVRSNPNASVGAGGGILALFVTWLAGNLFHWNVSAEDGALIATVISAVALFVGRNGIRGVARIVWRGGAAGRDGGPVRQN